MRHQLTTGVRVLLAVLIVSVGPLAFATAAPIHPQHSHSSQNSVPAPRDTLSIPSTERDGNPLTQLNRIIETSGYDDITLASAGNTVVTSYSRYDDSNPLENPSRLQIYEAIEDSPGASITEISDQTGIHRSTVRYHIRILEEEQLTTSKSHHGKHRLYPNDISHQNLHAALNDEALAQILDAIVHHEPLTVTALATLVDRTPGTVSYHLNRLADDELISRDRDGSAVAITAVAEVHELLLKDSIAVNEVEAPSSVTTVSPE
ncbi:MarR family transcriptional regulator [halophilic archaeon]|nr:MarR family transcriptional regulator [halophilic archaeon]